MQASHRRRHDNTRPAAERLSQEEGAEIKAAFELFDQEGSGKIYYRELKV
jgi:Ca2+-binding EF-hand superfamily protein